MNGQLWPFFCRYSWWKDPLVPLMDKVRELYRLCNFSNPWFPVLILGVTLSYAMRMTEPLNMSFQVSVSNNSSLKIVIWLSTLLKRVRNIWKGRRDGDSEWKSRLREKGSSTVDLETLSQGVEVSCMTWLNLIYTRILNYIARFASVRGCTLYRATSSDPMD